jgi:WD40 repeat protein
MVNFHPDSSRLLLFAADDRYEIRVWSLESSTCVKVLRGHYSAVTAIEFTSDGGEMYRYFLFIYASTAGGALNISSHYDWNSVNKVPYYLVFPKIFSCFQIACED